MKTKIILITLASIAICTIAFYRPKCEHVFSKVEQAVVKSEVTIFGDFGAVRSSDGNKGAELICVKCFHQQEQIFDLGPMPDGWTMDTTNNIIYSSGSTLLKLDNRLIIDSNGVWIIKDGKVNDK